LKKIRRSSINIIKLPQKFTIHQLWRLGIDRKCLCDLFSRQSSKIKYT
jgi:hypothetical protein